MPSAAPLPVAENEFYRRQLETVAANATLALFIMDEQQRCTYMNPAAERLTGYTLAEVQGRALHDVVHHTRPDGRPFPIAECPIDRAFPQNMQEQGEEVFVHRDGSFYPVAFTASPLREGGRTVGTIVEVRDIRGEKAAHQALREALDAAAAANAQLRHELEERARVEATLREQARTLEIVNRVNARLAGSAPLETLIQTVTDAGTELTGAEFGAFFYNMINDRGESYVLYTLSGVPREAFSRFPMPRNTEVFHPTFSGTAILRADDITQDPRYGKNAPYHGMPPGHLPVRSYLSVPVKAPGGEVLGGLFFGHQRAGVFTQEAETLLVGIADQAAIALEKARAEQLARSELAERRRAEAELKELNETLEQRVARRTAELEVRNRELQDFAYVASHDLQEPLRKIRSFADFLRTEEAARLSEEGAHLLDRMQLAAGRMSTLIRDLLAFSRVSTQQAPYEAVNLADVLDGVLGDLALRIEETGGHVEVGPMPVLEADPTQMRQLFQNLIGNALKYAREDVAPRVRVQSTVETERQGRTHREVCVITVEDNGIGFDEKYRDRIFAPFQRLHGKHAYEGTGMGLAIVRRIVERHEGLVEAHSTPGQGSRFVVRLPVHPGEAWPG